MKPAPPHCVICGQLTAPKELFATDRGPRCSNCKNFTEVECYQAIQRRYDEAINQHRVLAHDAWQKHDEMTFWECGANIKQMERDRDTMRKPAGLTPPPSSTALPSAAPES